MLLPIIVIAASAIIIILDRLINEEFAPFSLFGIALIVAGIIAVGVGIHTQNNPSTAYSAMMGERARAVAEHQLDTSDTKISGLRSVYRFNDRLLARKAEIGNIWVGAFNPALLNDVPLIEISEIQGGVTD